MNWKHWPGKSHCNKTQSRLSLPASRGSWVKDSRRDGRVVEGARLESVYTATYQGFESLSLRQLSIQTDSKNPPSQMIWRVFYCPAKSTQKHQMKFPQEHWARGSEPVAEFMTAEHCRILDVWNDESDSAGGNSARRGSSIASFARRDTLAFTGYYARIVTNSWRIQKQPVIVRPIVFRSATACFALDQNSAR
jgi:hypothetical protein